MVVLPPSVCLEVVTTAWLLLGVTVDWLLIGFKTEAFDCLLTGVAIVTVVDWLLCCVDIVTFDWLMLSIVEI